MGAKNICCPQLVTVVSVTGLDTGGWDQLPVLIFNVFLLIKPLGSP